jgi:hypothetical protein
MTAMKTLLTREQFRNDVLERDHNKCVLCPETSNLAVHHIMDRALFEDEGYYIDNGITLCETCHIKAESGIYTCQELREAALITDVILPQNLNPEKKYDKWGNLLTEELVKYPRTQHIEGSGLSKDDISETIPYQDLLQKYLVVEEKIDGSNTGISFNDDCELFLQCRGHFLKGGRDWPEFDQFKVWANTWKDQLFDILTNRYIMYGEWMGTFHSVFYDNLPHYFMEFDIWDKKDQVFLSTPRRHEILSKAAIPLYSVRVIKEAVFSDKDDILSCVGLSAFVSENSPKVLEETLRKFRLPEEDIPVLLKLNKERIMEGLYIKWEEDGVVKGRYKFVRPIFVQTILDYGKHWLKRQSVPNFLSPSANMFSIK